MSHKQCAEFFLDNRINRRNGSRYYRIGNVLYEDDYLYSYGRHFVLAYRMRNDQYPNNSKPMILLNTDTYSSSTRKHQNIADRAVREDDRYSSCKIDFSLLRQASIDHESIEIVSHQQGESQWFYSYDVGYHEFEHILPRNAEVYLGDTNGSRNYSVPEILLFKYKNKYFGCAGSFLIELPGKDYTNTDEIMSVLNPKVNDKDITFRRLSYVFVKMNDFNKEINKDRLIPIRINKKDFKPITLEEYEFGNATIQLYASKGVVVDGVTYVTGTVRVLNQKGLSVDKYRMMNLKGDVYKVVRNSEVNRWEKI